MFLVAKTFILIILSLTLVYGENNQHCPRFCKCDSYRQLNRAQCSSKRLISAEVDIPNQVEILDLSYNDITIVESKCFEKFSYLKYLNLSNNAIHTLDLEAFSKIRRLQEIDLSSNRLEYFDERLFESNKYLVTLNLEGNKFMSVAVKPFLRSISLKSLNLKNSQINFIHFELFSRLPNLMDLDLRENLLNNINVEDFRNLKKLKTLKLNQNSLKCDQSLKDKIKQLEERGINVTLDSCLSKENSLKFSPETEKFQKIVMASQNDMDGPLKKIDQWNLNKFSEDESDNEEDNDGYAKQNQGRTWEMNEWFRSAPDQVLCETPNTILCQKYRNCLLDLVAARHEKQLKNKLQFPQFSNDLKFPFFLGTALGSAMVILILACALCCKNCSDGKKLAHPDDLENITDHLPSQPLARLTTQLPPQVRRQPRRRAPAPPRAVVRYEGPVAENFLSRLFGRPARHQYYRSINQNTATLIRRLSRSNLFNNRLSQHFLDRQLSGGERSSAEAQDYAPSSPRPETPPPCYGDIVIDNFEERK